ncbi:MAG: hypothetical protein ACK5II_10595 [Paracoccus sp. (in: a-proteobacteria)]
MAPAETGIRFVSVAGSVTDGFALGSGYGTVRIRYRINDQISGLSDLDTRLSEAAAGLRAAYPSSAGKIRHDRENTLAASVPKDRNLPVGFQTIARALEVEIGGVRADIAVILHQMRTGQKTMVETGGQKCCRNG